MHGHPYKASMSNLPPAGHMQKAYGLPAAEFDMLVIKRYIWPTLLISITTIDLKRLNFKLKEYKLSLSSKHLTC